ncbi:hypothetical protein CsSME_00026735 [Camellia sinensis var. sinensis]
MLRHHIYDNIYVNCPFELDKSQIIRDDIRWPSRWDAYLKMEGAQVHWFSILNALMAGGLL